MRTCLLNFCVWLAVVVAFMNASNIDRVELNPQATLRNEVKSIQHFRSAREVKIHLAKDRNCTSPTFMARFSGTSMYLLDSVPLDPQSPDVIAFSYPPLVDLGTYFLEVISLYCETFKHDAFSSMCLVQPYDGKNVLTLPYSFEVKEVEHNLHPRPRWVLAHNATPALLPTRYQEMCAEHMCKPDESEPFQHNLYKWTDRPLYSHIVDKVIQNVSNATGQESLTVCMVGDSHAFRIYAQGNKLNIPHVNFGLIVSRYPQMFDVSVLTNCTYAVVSYGQWPLSYWMRGKPYNATYYEAIMRQVLASVVAANVSTQIFMSSLNLNGLGFHYTNCPASDFRHPPVVMMYNDIVSKLCREFKVPYIDMFHLQGPLWDGALDWNHPSSKVVAAEAEYIIHSVLSYSHAHHRAPVLDLSFAARVEPEWLPVPVRFSDSSTVYVLEGGVYRAFPDNTTMHRMGYRVQDPVTLVDADEKSNYQFGPVLPNI